MAFEPVRPICRNQRQRRGLNGLRTTGNFSQMDAGDRAYFLERAEEQLDLGNATLNAGAAQAHYSLAAFYLDRADGGAANDD